MRSNKQFYKQLFIAFLFNLIIVFVVASTYLKYVEIADYFASKVYVAISTISHFILLASPIFLLSALFFFVIKKRGLTKVFFVLISSLFILGLKLDSIVFSQFRYHLSPFVFRLVFGKKASDIFEFSDTTFFTVLLVAFLLMACQVLFLFLAKLVVKKEFNIRLKLLCIVFFTSLVCTHLVYMWADASYYRPVTQIASVYPLFHPLTAKRFLAKINVVDPEKAIKNRNLYNITTSNSIIYPLHKIESVAPEVKKNILFITLDSWRFDCMDSIVTPNMYNLSKKAQVFQKHFSGSNGTDGGIFSLFYGFTGLYWEQFTKLERSPVFIDEFLKQGYDIGIYGSANVQNPPFDKNVFSAVPNLRLSSKGDSPSARDAEITEEWITNLNEKEQDTPFFDFLFYDAAHGYDYPEDYNIKFKPSSKEVNYLDLDSNDTEKYTMFFNRYKNAVYYIDDLVGDVLKALEKNNLLESTIIVVTGDHGQELDDNKKGYWSHGGNFTKYQIQVPTFIFDASKAAKEYKTTSLHYDIVPTLMKNYMGVKNPIGDYSMGQDLYNLNHRDWFVCGYNNNYAIIEKERITKVYSTGLFDVTDLKLNKLMDAELNYDVIKEALEQINMFYEKKE